MSAAPVTGPCLELIEATKRFDTLLAVDALTVRLEPGQIHAIIGENGAGKSTALKLLAGHLRPDSGHLRFNGEPFAPRSAKQAMDRGIGMVHQHFMLIEAFSALQNLMLGAEKVGRWGVLDDSAARAHAEQVQKRSGLQLDLDRPSSALSVGERQRLEILRVLYRGASALLLDEPTAVLSPLEVDELYATLRRLADAGTTVAVVTHRLDEVVRWCDAVTVMRRGRGVQSRPLAASARGAELNDALTRAIMGGTPPKSAERPAEPSEQTAALQLSKLRVQAPDGRVLLAGVDLSLRPGEVVGVAGVEGNGQQALVDCLAGLVPLAGGSIEVDERPLFAPGGPSRLGARVAMANEAGVVVIHADRHQREMLLDANLADNLVLGDLGSVKERSAVLRRIGRFAVYPSDPLRLASELSGGNQQKVVMARALDRKIRVLVAAQPTRGVDVGTARVIQQAIAELASGGAAVLLISADLHELRALSHRIVVLRKGAVAAELASDASDETIGHAMLGTEAA